MTTYYYFATPYGAKSPKLYRITGVLHGKDRVKVPRRVSGLGFCALVSIRDIHTSPEAALESARKRANRSVETAENNLARAKAELAALPSAPGDASEEK